MSPDYTRQLERLIAVLSQKDSVPAWVVSLISVFVGSLATILFGMLKERYDAKRRLYSVERHIYGEMLSNYSVLLWSLKADLEFERVTMTQNVFSGMLSLDALEDAKTKVDSLFDIPNFGLIQTIYKVFRLVSDFSGPDVKVLAREALGRFETAFALKQINQELLIRMSIECAPNVKPRLVSLSENRIKPGELTQD